MPRSALPFEKARATMMEGYSDIALRSECVFYLEMYSESCLQGKRVR